MAYIYLGGFNKDKVVLNNVMRYEPMLDKWTKVANMNNSKSKNGSVLVFRKMTDFQLFIFWFIREVHYSPKGSTAYQSSMEFIPISGNITSVL